jgi:hypothetical protein
LRKWKIKQMNNLIKLEAIIFLLACSLTSGAMDQRNAPSGHYVPYRVISARQPTPIKDCMRNQTATYLSRPRDQYLQDSNCVKLVNFFKISKSLDSIPQNTDVHMLDDFVFGSQKQIRALLDAGRLYDEVVYHNQIRQLSLLSVGQAMIEFANREKPYFEKVFQYEGQSLLIAEITTILGGHFSSMDAEVGNICPEAVEVWSRAFVLALTLYKKDRDLTPLQIIYSQAIEGHLTRGGCIQGRINRGFVAYAAILAHAGVNLYRR